MALSVLKLGCRGLSPKLIAPTCIMHPQVATIVSKQLRDRDYQRAKPFDYKNKNYSRFYALIDKTTKRFDENSKIITVDGAIASGKTKLAKELAEELDMHYISAPHMDDMFINPYGIDMRQINQWLPPLTQLHDVDDFLRDPNHLLTARLQFNLFKLKLQRYLDALSHVLNTGQGVVMDTNVYADVAFRETLLKFGFISSKAHSYLIDSRDNTVTELMRPHVCIYLDVPVDEVLNRIKARNLPAEKDSPFYKPEILAYLEQMYKQLYLKEINKHAEILVYDWTDSAETEVVVEDIEQIDFDSIEDPNKMKDWDKVDEDQWTASRYLYTSKQDYVMKWAHIPRFDVPELFLEHQDRQTFLKYWNNAPGMKYEKGFNAAMGDTGIFFKM